jgi:hypothetical protein
MMAAVIFVFALIALLQFFIYYCRSLIAAFQGVELSEQTRELTGIEDHFVSGDEFGSLLQLARMCPELDNDGREIGAVRVYYSLLRFFGPLMPWADNWTKRERANCAYFAAVALDRRITRNRDLFAQQTSGTL